MQRRTSHTGRTQPSVIFMIKATQCFQPRYDKCSRRDSYIRLHRVCSDALHTLAFVAHVLARRSPQHSRGLPAGPLMSSATLSFRRTHLTPYWVQLTERLHSEPSRAFGSCQRWRTPQSNYHAGDFTPLWSGSLRGRFKVRIQSENAPSHAKLLIKLIYRHCLVPLYFYIYPRLSPTLVCLHLYVLVFIIILCACGYCSNLFHKTPQNHPSFL